MDKGESEPLYIIPRQPYQFEHPEGTGHDTGSPFESMWFVHLTSLGGGADGRSSIFKEYDSESINSLSRSMSAKICEYISLSQEGGVKMAKRLNPRQRKAMALKGRSGDRPISNNEGMMTTEGEAAGLQNVKGGKGKGREGKGGKGGKKFKKKKGGFKV